MATPILPPGSQIQGAHRNYPNTMPPKVGLQCHFVHAPLPRLYYMAGIVWKNAFKKWLDLCARKTTQNELQQQGPPRCSLDKESVAEDKAARRVQLFLQTLPANLCQQSFPNPVEASPEPNLCACPCSCLLSSLTACRMSHPCRPNTNLRLGPASQATSLRNSLYMTPHTKNLEVLSHVRSSSRSVRIQACSTNRLLHSLWRCDILAVFRT